MSFKKTEIYEGGNPWIDAIKGTDDLLERATALDKKLTSLAQTIKGDLQKAEIGNAKALRKTTELQKIAVDVISQKKKSTQDISALEKERTRLLDQSRKQLAKNLAAQERQNKVLQKGKIQYQERQKDIKAIIQLQRAERGSIDQLQKVNSILSKKRKQLGDINGKNRKTYERLTRAIDRNGKQIAAHNRAIGRHQDNVGNYGSALSGVRKNFATLAIGVGVAFGAIRRIGSAISGSVKTFIEFENTMAKVAAVSGAAAGDFRRLRKQAKDLGATSQNSASQVASLQLELSKLGFNATEIQQATESINNLSIATGEDLANSAGVAAGNVKAFNLDASETVRVTDVMAKAFSSSALDLEKFKTASASAGTVVASAGGSIEEMTAQLGVLVDRNLDASTAGTSLRNIYLEIAKRGISAADAFKMINKAADPASKAMELFGKRGAVAGVILAQNQKEVEGLTDKLNDSAGSARIMADIMADNLAGDTKAASSAIEGLQIAIGDRLNDSIRDAVQGFTTIISSMSKIIGSASAAEKAIESEREEVFKLTAILQDNNATREEQERAMLKLEKIAPDIAKAAKSEKDSVLLINKALDEYIEKTIQRIALAQLNEKQEKLIAQAGQLRANSINQIAKAQEMLSQVDDRFIVTEGNLQEQIEGTIKNMQEYLKTTGEKEKVDEATMSMTGAVAKAMLGQNSVFSKGIDLIKSSTDSRSEELKQYHELRGLLASSTHWQSASNKLRKDEIPAIQQQIQAIKDLISIKKEEPNDSEDENSQLDGMKEATREVMEEMDKLATRGGGSLETVGESIDKLKVKTDDLRHKTGLVAEAALSPEILGRFLGENEITLQTLTEQYQQYYDELEELRRDDELSEQEYSKAIINAKREEVREKAKLVQQAAQTANDISRQSTNLVTNLIQLEQSQFQDSENATTEEKEANAAKRKEIAKKYADFQLATNIAEIASNTALGITRAIASPGFPAAAALIPLIAANGLLQGAIAVQQRNQVKSLGTGGYGDEYGNIHGDRHSAPSGGEDFKEHIKVEGGESWSVWNRRTKSRDGDRLADLTSHVNSTGLDDYLASHAFVAPTFSSNFNADGIIKEQKRTNEMLSKHKNIWIDKLGNEVHEDLNGNRKIIRK